MSEMKPTLGPWSVDDALPGDAFRYVIHGEGDSFGHICRISINGNANAEDDAHLIAEAGTVFHNTGLSPVQLVEMVKELKEALEMGLEIGAQCSRGFLGKFQQKSRAALAKCEGVK